MDDVIDKFLGSSGNNGKKFFWPKFFKNYYLHFIIKFYYYCFYLVTFDMKVKAIQDLDEVIFDTTDLTNVIIYKIR